MWSLPWSRDRNKMTSRRFKLVDSTDEEVSLMEKNVTLRDDRKCGHGASSSRDEKFCVVNLEVNNNEHAFKFFEKAKEQRDFIMEIVSKEDISSLNRVLEETRQLSSSFSKQCAKEFLVECLTSKDIGKTCLMKALLNINGKTEEIVHILLSFAEKHGFLDKFINAKYTFKHYKGHTALHIAIERRQYKIVKYLIDKGAEVDVFSKGSFFKNRGFYFGQTPLALAACTNQPDIVTLLMDNSKTNIKIQDSYGNTVLHALVTVTMDQEPHNAFIIQMYDKIIRSCKDKALESKKNKKGLTSMQLAVTEGKLEILKYILNREIKDDENRMWSWKITDWSYGPVSSIFYDLEGVDTSSKKSILEMLVYNTDIKDRHEMLNLEPLHSLLQMKWDKFARHMFLLSFLFFFIFDIIFTCLFYLQRKDDKALKLSQQNRSAFKPSGTKSWLQVLGHVYVLTCSICIIIEESFLINRLTFSDLQSVVSDAWFNIIFITQAVLVILSSITYMCGIEESLIFMVIAITLGWTNMLYYTRGFQSLGIYSVMVQKVILNDVSKFLLVYLLFLLGFGVALASLIEHCAEGEDCSSYGSFRTAIVELFKLTLGLGDLEMQKDAKYPTLFLILLIIYVISTFVLLLNMLIALMSETVDNISKESENIWRLQRASTILKFEKTIKFLFGDKFRLGVMHNFSDNDKRLCLRISKVKWSEWHRAVTCVQEEGVTQSKVKEADGFSSITAVDVSDRGRHPIIVQENEEDSDMEIFSSSEIQNY